MLIVVRHGRTAANAAGELLGRRDPGLDEVGRAQAEALATWIDHVDHVVSSPLLRTVETAQAFGLPIQIDQRLIELDYGSWDGTPVGNIAPDQWATWRADLDFAPPGGESLRSLGTRVRAACEDLAALAQKRNVVVLTHVSPIKAILGWAVGAGDETAWRCFVSQASIMRIDVTRSGPTLRSFNEIAPLRP